MKAALQPPYAEIPNGYQLRVYYSALAAREAHRTWGVAPLLIGPRTWVLWIPLCKPPKKTQIVRDAREWAQKHGEIAARVVAGKNFPAGQKRFLAHAEFLGVPIPTEYSTSMQLIRTFLEAARADGGVPGRNAPVEDHDALDETA